jgi:hypothetical protein
VVAIVSLLFGIGYGVLFKQIYPLVAIDSGIVSLCAILGLTTSLAGIGAWKVVTKIANSKRKDEKVFGLISQPIEPDSSHFRAKTADVELLNPNQNIFVSFSKQDQATALEF